MEQSTLIKDYSTSLVKALFEKVKSIQKLNHKLTKGELRELFLNDLLVNFLTEQFGVGTGVVIDSYGNESKQTDLIIYDKRILPAIIKNSNLGTYPIESVLAVIEVKSILGKKELIKTNSNFAHLETKLKFNEKFDKNGLSIIKCIIGFNKRAISEINKDDDTWLKINAKHINAICHVQNYCWIKYPRDKGWRYSDKDKLTFEETKRFIAWTLDNARNKSNRRYKALCDRYIPWMSMYIRNNKITH